MPPASRGLKGSSLAEVERPTIARGHPARKPPKEPFMKPLRLTDAELTHVFEAARPISVVGPGTVHRAILQAQRAHFDPPDLEASRSMPRWGRTKPEFQRISK